MSATAGAHLTSSTISQPSVFEILSHEGFANTLKPAAGHVLKFLAERNPEGKFGFIHRYFDELYLAFDSVVQWHYILTRGATLSEAFYGLERKLVSNEQILFKTRLSYTLTVILPYVHSKLENLYISLRERESGEMNLNSSTTKQVKYKTNSAVASRKFLQCYPHIKTLLKTLNIFYLLSYTFGRSEYHSLTFRILGMTLRYTSEERSKFMQQKNAELWMSSEWKDFTKLHKLVLRSVGESVLFVVEIGTFFMQFLEWWQNDDRRSRATLTNLPVPPAPQTCNNIQNIVTLLPSDMNKCPLCRKEFRNPTAISVSGIVYCYSCIMPHLLNEKTCPMTNLVCDIHDLIRIYQ